LAIELQCASGNRDSERPREPAAQIGMSARPQIADMIESQIRHPIGVSSQHITGAKRAGERFAMTPMLGTVE
jgi:hypothetical protein